MQSKTIISVAVAALMVTACQQGGRPPGGISKQDVGTVGGAVVGGILGSNVGKGKGQIAGTIGGALLGGMLGSNIGASLDRADMQYYDQTSQRALENAQPGQTMPWKNPQSGNYGTVTPSNYYQTASGQYCREYTQTITVGGQTQEGHGTACRQPDGTWQIVQ